MGEAAALPSRIRISHLTKERLPDSQDIKFAKGWLSPLADTEALDAVAKRWVGKTVDADSG